MQMINEQFKKCKDVFVQYKVFLPILAGMIIALAALGFTFGQQIGETKAQVEKVESYYEVLTSIKTSVDSLVKK